MNIAEAIVFVSMAAILYIYIGYPVTLFIISKLITKKVSKGDYEPFVSILIAAYNENNYIGKTLENKLSLDYPKNKCEIIVISDGSTDGTDDIVRTFEGSGVKLLRQQPRAGKTNALNMAVPRAGGEIIVFADANSIYQSDALRKLIRNFNDASVGYATGKMVYEDPEHTNTGEGCSAFMKYENALRSLETKIGSIVGVNGGIDAVRKELYTPMRQDQLPDFVLPLSVVNMGYRVIYEPEAILRETSLQKSGDEYYMRLRVSLRAFCALRDMSCLLTFRKSSLFAWQLWSHKVMRYLCFIFLAGLYAGNLFLLTKGEFYYLLFFLQTLGYSAALISPLLSRIGVNAFSMLNYFVLINAAASHAFLKFLLGQKQVLWTPRKG